MPSWEQKMMKPWMNAQLFGCSWVSATFSLVNRSFFEGKAKYDFGEECGLEEVKWSIRVQLIVTTYRLLFPTLYYFY